MRVYKDVNNRNALCPKLIGTLELINRDSCSRHYKKRYLLFQKLSLVCLISASARHKGRKFTTIAKNQWLLRWPLPLMEWYLLNHWDQWFFDGFSVSQPLATMVFNCCQPLVQRCDGNDTSFRSRWFWAVIKVKVLELTWWKLWNQGALLKCADYMQWGLCWGGPFYFWSHCMYTGRSEKCCFNAFR